MAFTCVESVTYGKPADHEKAGIAHMVTVVTEAEQVAEYVARSTYTQTEYALQDSILTVSKYCISLTYYKVS